MKLDRSRPYGEIFGGTGGARYMQDDMLFTADGEAMGNKAQAKPEVEVATAAEEAAFQAAAAAPTVEPAAAPSPLPPADAPVAPPEPPAPVPAAPAKKGSGNRKKGV